MLRVSLGFIVPAHWINMGEVGQDARVFFVPIGGGWSRVVPSDLGVVVVVVEMKD